MNRFKLFINKKEYLFEIEVLNKNLSRNYLKIKHMSRKRTVWEV